MFCLNCNCVLIISFFYLNDFTFGALKSHRYLTNIVISRFCLNSWPHTFYCKFCRGIKYSSLYQELRYIEDRYIVEQEQSPFFLRDSRASERRARVKITPFEKSETHLGEGKISSRFARSTIPEEKRGLLVVYYIGVPLYLLRLDNDKTSQVIAKYADLMFQKRKQILSQKIQLI